MCLSKSFYCVFVESKFVSCLCGNIDQQFFVFFFFFLILSEDWYLVLQKLQICLLNKQTGRSALQKNPFRTYSVVLSRKSKAFQAGWKLRGGESNIRVPCWAAEEKSRCVRNRTSTLTAPTVSSHPVIAWFIYRDSKSWVNNATEKAKKQVNWFYVA